ncbi:MAG: hypothetical protein WKG32_06635 [Gemmatimonadaceae bacterium]
MIATIAVIVALHVPPRAAPSPDRWFGMDKVKHFFVSAFIQSVTYSTLRGARASYGVSMAGASLATATFAVGKEVSDLRRRGQFSVRDLAWDAAGAAGASALLARTDHTAR